MQRMVPRSPIPTKNNRGYRARACRYILRRVTSASTSGSTRLKRRISEEPQWPSYTPKTGNADNLLI